MRRISFAVVIFIILTGILGINQLIVHAQAPDPTVTPTSTPTSDITASLDFSPSTISLKSVSRLTITLTNANTSILTNAGFANLFPVGLSVADPANMLSDCNGTIAVNPGVTSITMTNGIVPARVDTVNGACTISVDVGAADSGNLTANINAGDLTGYFDRNYVSNNNTTSAILNVAEFDFNAEMNKSFDPINITPGDISRLSVSIYNSNAFELDNAAWVDNLANIQPGLYIANPANVYTTGCGTTPIVTAVFGSSMLSLSGAIVPAKVGQTNGTCTVQVNVSSITPGNLINTIPGGVLTAVKGGSTETVSNTDPASATLNVDILVQPSVTKSFNPNTIWVGQTSRLTIAILNGDPTHTLTHLFLSDDLSNSGASNIIFSGTVSPSLSASCGTSAALTAVAGSTSLSLAEAQIAPGATCQIQVNVTSNIQGAYLNKIPVGAIQDQQGVSNIAVAQGNLNAQAVGLLKSFSPTTILAGDISTLTITLRNPTDTDYQDAAIKDVMPGNDLFLTGTPSTTCGTGVATITTTNRSNDTIQLTGGQVPAGTYTTPGSCTITVDVTTANIALTRTHTNTIPAGVFSTNVPGVTNPSPATATLNVQALSIGIVKSFSPVSFEQGGKTRVFVTLQNPTSSIIHVTNLTDNLPTGLVPDPTTAVTTCINGQATSVVDSPSTLTLSGLDGNGAQIPAGTISTPGTCNFSVQVTTTTAKTYTNSIAANSITTVEGLTNLSGTSNSITVYPTGQGMTASKSFSNNSIIAGGNSRLRIALRAPDDQDLSGVSLVDNLPTNVTISNSTAATNSCGGTLTAATGATTITLAGGSITKSNTCYINVYVTAAISGNYTNTIHTSDITDDQHEIPPSNFSDTLYVSNMTMSKAFYPSTVAPMGRSTLTITLTNTNTSPITGVSLSDNLNTMGGTDFTVASPSNASTTCEGGAAAGTPGSQLVTLSGGTVPSQINGVPGICTINIDVQAGSIATLPTARTDTLYRMNVSGTIAGIGTIHPVADTSTNLTVTGLTLGVVKGFSPLTVFGGSISTMSVQLINPNNAPLTGIAFTDTMPAGMYIANPADPSTGTCGGTVTAVPNSNTLTFSGGTLAAGKRCTVTVSTTMNVHGNRTNTIPIGSVTSFNGAKNSQAAQASLTNLPGASITKFFTPNTVTLGDTSLLTIQIKNTSNIPLHNMGLVDTLPTGLKIAESPAATNACGGSLVATPGTVTINLIAGGITAGPNTTCNIVVPVIGTVAGTYTNIINKDALTTSEGATNTEVASDVLVINPPPNLQFSKTLDTADSDPVPYNTDPAHDNLVYSLVATNMGNVNLTNVTIADPDAIMGTCTPAQPATLLPGQTLTCQASYTITEDDVTAGFHANTATVDSDQTEPKTDTLTVPMNQANLLNISKVITKPGPYQIGDTLNYNITVTKSGLGTLHGVTVTDPDAILGTCIPAQPVDLASSAVMTCTDSHIVTKVDVAAGLYTNTVSAVSVETTTPVSATVTVPIEDNAKLKVFKQITSNGPYNILGKSITYDISAINTGTMTLTNVSIADPDVGVTMDACTPAQPATLAPGEILSCPAHHVINQDDLTAGGYDNTAIAVSDQTEPVSDTAEVITKVPVIQLTKTGVLDDLNGNGRADAAEKINYTFTVANTGEVTLTNITLIDIVGGVSISGGPITSLAPGNSDNTTFIGTYTLTQADIDAGMFTNIASVTGAPPVGSNVSDTDSYTQTLEASPSISLVKTGTLNIGLNSRVDTGDTITYAFTVTNTGNVTLNNVKLTDPTATISGGSIATLAPGVTDTTTFTGTYTLTQSDVDAGTFTNTATVTGTPPTGDDVTAQSSDTKPLPADKKISLLKTGVMDMTVVAPPGVANKGDKITYTFTVSNPGNVTLTNVIVTDPKVTVSGTAITLAPGVTDSTHFTGTYTLTQADVDAGTFTNTATVSGKPPLVAAITSTSSDTKTLPPVPSITLEKTGTLDLTIVSPGTRADAGDKINYTFKVTNTGNVTLSNVTVTDPKIGSLTGSPIASLAPGAASAVTLTGSHTLTQADIDSGGYSNTATTSGNPPTGSPVTSTDGDSQTLVAVPSVTLVKTGALHQDTVPPINVTNPGDTITYTFTVTNTGNVTLTGLTVVDTVGGITIKGDPIATMLPGAIDSTTYTGTYTLKQTDIDAGIFNNTATVTGTTPTNGTVTNTAGYSQPGLETPSISLIKAGTLHIGTNSRVDAGDTITYTFVVVNTGNVALTNVHITDLKATISGGPISLAIGASDTTTFTGTYMLTQTDVDAGTFTNMATVTGTPPTGSNVTAQSSDTQTLLADKQIALVKNGTVNLNLVAPNGIANVGDQITYTFTVSNPGNVTLTNVIVTDPKVTVSGTAITLAPGATDSTHFTGTYTLKQSDIDAGTFTNTATVNGTPPSGTEITATDHNTQNGFSSPAITLVKTGTLNEGTNGRADAGDTITYTFTLTNTGNVALINVHITDPDAVIFGGPISLAIGASDSTSFTGTYTLKQSDIDAGTFTNTATVTGTPPTGSNVTSQSSDTKSLASGPRISLVKSGTVNMGSNDRPDANDTVSYSFTVTNTGNVTLTNVMVTDPLITVHGGPITLAPGVTDNSTFTGTYTLKQSDIDAGTFTNTATVTGNPPIGSPVSDSSTFIVKDLEVPGIALVKTDTLNMGGNGRVDEGDTITYAFKITNTGNVALTNVQLSDLTSNVTLNGSTISKLAIGASDSGTYAATYTLTQANINSGTFTNTAKVTGTPPTGSDVTAQDSVATDLPADKQITLVKTGTLDLTAVDPKDVANPGDLIRYTFTISNPGNVPLTGVKVTDPKITVFGGPISLDPGQTDTTTFTGVYTLAQTDIDAGTFTNTATAAGMPPIGLPVEGSSSDTQINLATPVLTLQKTGVLDMDVVAPTGVVDAGDQINYTFTVTNAGNVALSNVRVTDPKATISGGPISSLAIGANDTATFTGTYTLTQVDIDAGTFTNTATVTGTPPTGSDITAQSSDTRTFTPVNAITLQKIGTLHEDVVTPDDEVDVGDQITYQFIIQNTGNVTLTGVKVTDPAVTVFSSSLASDGSITLAPGAADDSTFTGTYTLTQTDIDSGTFNNTATVTGTPPSGPAITNTGANNRPLGSNPVIGVAKRVVSIDKVSAGVYDVTMEILARNYGNVTLHDVNIKDDLNPTFPAPTTFNVQSLSSTDSLLLVNSKYDGDKDINMLLAGNTLAAGQSTKVTLVVRVTPTSNGPYDNIAVGYGTSPSDTIVTDQSQDGTNPDSDNDGNPTNNNEPTPVNFGSHIFDPAYGMKTFDGSQMPVMTWNMVWINDQNIVSVANEVHDPIPLDTAYITDFTDSGVAVPAGAPTGSTSKGVTCTVTGTSVTILCYYEGPTVANPRGQIVWSGVLGPDFGITDPALANNAVHITFSVKYLGTSPKVTNIATVDTDLNGNGDTTDSGEQNVASANASWVYSPPVLPKTGFAPGDVTQLPSQPQALAYSSYGDMMIDIPALNLQSQIIGVPESGDSWNVAWLGNNIGWLNGTAFPTHTGNAVLTGHVVDANGLPGPFDDIGKLKYGDQIIIHAWNQEYVYEVREIQLISATDTKDVLKHEDLSWITLLTCRNYDAETGTYLNRYIVRAVLVKVQ
jgi:LPXTG-site transpeptidase (sortase) family protein